MSGAEILALRTSVGMSRAEFGGLVGASAMSVWRWETGQATPTGLYAKSLEDLVGRVAMAEQASRMHVEATA